MPTCTDGGALVSATGWLPPDPWDHYWGNQGPVAGCNHIVCRRCAQTVRSFAGFTKPPGGDPDPRDILDAGSPEGIDGIEANDSQCRHFVENSIGLVTALVPVLGYGTASAVAAEALKSGSSVAQVLRDRGLWSDEVAASLAPERMANPD